MLNFFGSLSTNYDQPRVKFSGITAWPIQFYSHKKSGINRSKTNTFLWNNNWGSQYLIFKYINSDFFIIKYGIFSRLFEFHTQL